MVEDTEMKEKFAELNHQLKIYEKREREIVARENVILEREETQRQVSNSFNLKIN